MGADTGMPIAHILSKTHIELRENGVHVRFERTEADKNFGTQKRKVKQLNEHKQEATS